MAGETLREAAGLLGLFPDNVSGEIDAVDSRDFIVSSVVAVGFIEEDPLTVPYTIPMTDGVPVDFLSTLTTPLFAGNFWKLDGNNAFIPSYTDFGVTVPPGLQRLVSGDVIMQLQKVGGGTGVYEFQGTEGGVFTGEPVQRTISAVAEVFVFSGTRLYDVSVAGPISLSITPVGTSDDLQVNQTRVSLQGVML